MLHAFSHTFSDTIKILPFIFLIYLLIEYLEHKNNTALSHILMRSKKSGAVCGAVLGSIPQCGFSVIASDLFSKRVISLGTLISIFVATSDEAIPILLSGAASVRLIALVIVIKIFIAVLCGIIIDLVYKDRQTNSECHNDSNHTHFHGNCESCEGGIVRSAVVHSLKIFVYIFIVSFIFSLLLESFGEEQLSAYLLKDTPFQPLIATLIGLIPNCAASVMLTEGYLEGALSIGSLVGGLCAGAGVGMIVLFKRNKNLKQNLSVIGLLYLIGTTAGIIIDLF